MSDETRPDHQSDSEALGTGKADLAGEIGINPGHQAVNIVDDEEDHTEVLLPFPVVALGASAGGLPAYLELFRNLPPDTGMSFVVLPHLAADHASEFVPILSAATPMPVSEMQHGGSLQPNEIYVLPPNMRATLQRGSFHLDPRPSGERIPMPIDIFFRSLASAQKNRSIGVILSGADSDGALGLRAIKGEGGIAIVQDPDSAQVSDMPRSGILADHVDLVLTPAEIGPELARLARQFFQPSLRRLEEGDVAAADEPHFKRLLTLLRTVSGIEFSNYKPGTLRRRVARRMILRRMERLPEYIRLLQESGQELLNLHEDILINVTRFFRDPSVFDALRNDILPTLLDNRPPDQQVRIWVAGCSTGEEAYSIAICLLEYLAGQPNEPPIQIFGTDASERSIEKARMAMYPDSIARDIPPERIRRYFVKTDKGYQIAKRVRDLCIFARQNLCNDPPFSRLDLISCRNVLIYVNRETQNAILNTFRYALRPTGCLLLGRSESVSEMAGLLTPIDKRNKFYAKLGDSSGLKSLIAHPSGTRESLGSATSSPELRPFAGEADLQRAADRVVIARHGPPGAIINDALDVVEIRGRPAPFLAISPGTPSLNLLRMAHGDLIPVLRDAVNRAIDGGVPVVEQIAVHQASDLHPATLEVLPIQVGSAQVRHYLVLFVPGRVPEARDHDGAAPRPELNADHGEVGRELERLQRDLTHTRLYLQSLIEERDARNQELTAAYEEIQSSNEELQSTNEELETAKEELQSTNEELQTVNDELRNRNQALIQASNDLNNLLNSVNIPVIMLGNDLTIRQFTPPAERLMRFRAADIGRPISEIRLNLMMEEIEPLLHEVLETLITKELDVQDRSGRWHLLRIRPYRTSDNKIDGVVLLLLDIDLMRRSQVALQQARDFAQSVVETMQVPVVVLDSELRVRTANAAFRTLSGLDPADLERRAFVELLSMLWDWPDLRAPLMDLLQKQNGAMLETEHETSKPIIRSLRLAGRLVLTDNEPTVLIVLEDVTVQKQVEHLLESDRDRLAGQVRSTAEILGRTRGELRALTARLFTSQEDERRRVARELHDDVSQKLALLEIDVEALRQNISAEPQQVKGKLEDIRERLGVLSEDVRNLSHQLHPSSIEHLGLSSALKGLVEEFGRREGMFATFRGVGLPDTVSRDVATALYRITQEALRNVAKHAGRTHVKVLLEGGGEGLRLSIRDLGEGFDVEGSARRGLGLVSMEERARLIGGMLTVESTLGHGTCVTVTAPLTGDS